MAVADTDSATSTTTQTLSSSMTQLLFDYQDIFEIPTGLPPSRSKEHSIPLHPGTSPISVRHYRYPQPKKNEIEKLVAKMLQAGIIKPSTSPYSSPMLLVKKKEGSWRFCVDYRALNKATIVDKFTISVIEELLDELHQASMFSKIDLKSRYHQIYQKQCSIHTTTIMNF